MNSYIPNTINVCGYVGIVRSSWLSVSTIPTDWQTVVIQYAGFTGTPYGGIVQLSWDECWEWLVEKLPDVDLRKVGVKNYLYNVLELYYPTPVTNQGLMTQMME